MSLFWTTQLTTKAGMKMARHDSGVPWKVEKYNNTVKEDINTLYEATKYLSQNSWITHIKFVHLEGWLFHLKKGLGDTVFIALDGMIIIWRNPSNLKNVPAARCNLLCPGRERSIESE